MGRDQRLREVGEDELSGEGGRCGDVAESAGTENGFADTLGLREPGPAGRSHRRASVSASSQGLFCAKWWEILPRGLMFLSLDLRVTVFFLPQLIPSIRDLKEDHKDSRTIPLLSPRRPRTGTTCCPFTDLFLVSLWTASFGE